MGNLNKIFRAHANIYEAFKKTGFSSTNIEKMSNGFLNLFKNTLVKE